MRDLRENGTSLHHGGQSRLGVTANLTHWANVGLLLGQRRRRCANNKPALTQCVVLQGWCDSWAGDFSNTTRETLLAKTWQVIGRVYVPQTKASGLLYWLDYTYRLIQKVFVPADRETVRTRLIRWYISQQTQGIGSMSRVCWDDTSNADNYYLACLERFFLHQLATFFQSKRSIDAEPIWIAWSSAYYNNPTPRTFSHRFSTKINFLGSQSVRTIWVAQDLIARGWYSQDRFHAAVHFCEV